MKPYCFFLFVLVGLSSPTIAQPWVSSDHSDKESFAAYEKVERLDVKPGNPSSEAVISSENKTVKVGDRLFMIPEGGTIVSILGGVGIGYKAFSIKPFLPSNYSPLLANLATSGVQYDVGQVNPSPPDQPNLTEIWRMDKSHKEKVMAFTAVGGMYGFLPQEIELIDQDKWLVMYGRCSHVPFNGVLVIDTTSWTIRKWLVCSDLQLMSDGKSMWTRDPYFGSDVRDPKFNPRTLPNRIDSLIPSNGEEYKFQDELPLIKVIFRKE